jgi:hypothetical protein
VEPNPFDSGDPHFSLRKFDATLALVDAREVFEASFRLHGSSMAADMVAAALVQVSGDFIDSVIFGSDKNSIGDLMPASNYRLELCSTVRW